MMSMSILLTLILSVFIKTIKSHSWIRCADYEGDINGWDYDENKCNAWMRDWPPSWIQGTPQFGQDLGADYELKLGASICENQISGSPSNGYSDDYKGKKADYISGEQIRLIHPAKNHANYGCHFNVPDNQMKLYYNPNVNPSTDLPNNGFSMEENGYKLVKDWHSDCTPGTDGCGYQNCPDFCNGPNGDTDKAVCFQDFIVPSVKQSGYYTFVWFWEFNKNQYYTACWEAYINSDGSSQPPPVSSPTIKPTSSSNNNNNNNGDMIIVNNQESTQTYYLQFGLENIDASSCGDNIKKVQINDNNTWRDNDQIIWNNRYGFEYKDGGNTFDDLLPISIKIIMYSGKEIILPNIINNLHKSQSFISNKSIC